MECGTPTREAGLSAADTDLRALAKLRQLRRAREQALRGNDLSETVSPD